VQYTATSVNGTEYLRLNFKPSKITINGVLIPVSEDIRPETYTIRSLGNGDFSITLNHKSTGMVVISR